MSGFFEEVQRRKVYRVAAGYVIAAGFIIQIASAAFPAWELPNWSLRLVIVLLLIGFPIGLILGWAFDVTPQGLQATKKIATETHHRRNFILLVTAGLIASAAAGFFLLPRSSAGKLDKSIAVLPFENLSGDPDNAYFADGMQDDILTNLSKISDLKVISRTSVMSYRGKGARNVRDIGKELGVSTLLEGSVRRIGNRVRVNVQLIDTSNDQHIWAEDYDRDLTDVFAIQSDLAQKISSELQAKLSPVEKAQITHKPTENSEAYLAYMQAGNFSTPEDLEKLKQAEQLYERALQLDPNFALASARLSQIESWIFHFYDPTPARRARARALAEQALKLQPELPEGHLALGYCFYYGDVDYDRAWSEFKIAQNGLPNASEVYLSLAAIERRQGKWAESTADFEKAVSVSPKDAFVLQNLGINYAALGNYEAASKTYDRAIEVAPASFSSRALKSKLAIDWKGDVSVAERELAHLAPGFDPQGMVTAFRVSTLFLQRRFSDALALLQQVRGDALRAESGTPLPKTLFEGICYYFANDKTKAREAFENARVFVERQVSEMPDDAGRHAELGVILVALGRKDEAIREGKRASELLPESKDAFEGPAVTISLAQIYAWAGETDQALSLLEHSLRTPNGITVAVLKLDPVWDPLRKDPRFQRLIEQPLSKQTMR